MYEIDFDTLSRDLLTDANTLVPNWLPGGKLMGKEWTCGDLMGGPGSSCRVNIQTGKWADFATGETGGDLISLFAAIKGVSQKDAAMELSGNKPPTHTLAERAKKKTKPRPDAEEVKIIPLVTDGIPDDIQEKGYEKIHTYHTHNSQPWFYIGRKVWTNKEGKRCKSFIPYIYVRGEWINKAPNPRPLYNLHEIKKVKQVIICEGEKAADAANKFHPAIKATTIMGGSNNLAKADLSPLFDKNVVIWPDNDAAGLKLKDELIEKLSGKAKTIKYFDVSELGKKEDAADIKFDSPVDFISWAKEHTINVDHKKKNPVLKEPEPVTPDFEYSINPRTLDEPEVFDERNPPPPEDETPPPVRELNENLPDVVDSVESVDARTIMVKMADDVDLIPYDTVTTIAIEQAGLSMRSKFQPHSSEYNAVQILNRVDKFYNKFYWDTFHQDVYTCIGYPDGEWGPVTEKVKIDILLYMQAAYKLSTISLAKVEMAIYRVAVENELSEPAEWIKSLQWDGKMRLDTFFQDVFGIKHQPAEYLKVVANNLFVSLVARVMEPGCQVDTMCVFEGKQGLKKSTFLKAIVGKKYYVKVSTKPEDKDSLMAMKGAMIVEVEELASFFKSDHKHIKGFISREVDALRNPYGKVLNKVPRQSIFIGTTNERRYLDDYTGGRRFYPIEIKTEADMKYIEDNREQFFAEAFARYSAGVKWYDNEPAEYFEHLLKKKDRSDAWNDIFLDWLEDTNPSIVCLRKFGETVLEVDKKNMNSNYRNRLNEIMQRNGFEKMDREYVKIDGKSARQVYYDTKRFKSFDEAWDEHKGIIKAKQDERTKMPESRKNWAPGYEHTLTDD